MGMSSNQPATPSAAHPGYPWGLKDYRNWLWLALWGVIIGGWFYPLLGLAVPVCFLGAIVTSVFVGRKWCGKVCPRGLFSDVVVKRLAWQHKMPAWAKHPATRLGVMAFMFAMMGLQLPPVWGLWEQVGRVLWTLLTATTLVATILGLFTHQRIWCQVCPAGTLAAWAGKRRPPKLNVDADRCKNCNLCGKECPMDLRPHENAEPAASTHMDCLKCGACVGACPIGALQLGTGNTTRGTDTTAADAAREVA